MCYKRPIYKYILYDKNQTHSAINIMQISAYIKRNTYKGTENTG